MLKPYVNKCSAISTYCVRTSAAAAAAAAAGAINKNNIVGTQADTNQIHTSLILVLQSRNNEIKEGCII